MAVNRVPVLKRCRSLGLDPIYLGIDKKSTRQLKRANRKMSWNKGAVGSLIGQTGILTLWIDAVIALAMENGRMK